MVVERIKICQTGKYYVPCSKKFKDTSVSSQKEQSCIYDVAAFDIAHNDSTKVRVIGCLSNGWLKHIILDRTYNCYVFSFYNIAKICGQN